MNLTATRVPLIQRWRIGLGAIAGFVLLASFLISMPVLVVWSAWVGVAVFVLALLLALVWGALMAMLGGRRLWRHGLRNTVIAFALLTVLLALPVYFLVYKVQADPPLLPTVVLANGERTVVYQGMVHVGMESFYKSVVYDLEAALAEGYTLYYEGVQPSPGEGDEWFSEHLAGGGDLAENYHMLAEACGVKFQNDYFELLAADAGVHPDQHVAADVTSLEMKQEYDRLMASDAEFARVVQAQEEQDFADSAEGGEDGIDLLLAHYQDATDSQKTMLGVLCRGVFALALGDGAEKSSRPLDRVVLDFRNRKLVERILADSSDRIYITYGAAHLPGVVALLQEADAGWHVKSIKWMRGLAAPEKLEGSMVLPGMDFVESNH